MTAPPPLSIAHSVRASALEPEKTWKVSGDTLWMCIEGQPDIPLPLRAILKLRLSYDPSRIERNLFRCHLYNTGGKCATIQNVHYQGIASFSDRSETYLPFTRALIDRLAAANPRCEFIAGTSHLSWWAHAAFLTVAFGLLSLALFFLYTAVGPLAIIKLLIVAFFIPTTIRWFSKNRPKKFTPHTIPENLLPEAQPKDTRP
jgi:hypothetical protein